MFAAIGWFLLMIAIMAAILVMILPKPINPELVKIGASIVAFAIVLFFFLLIIL